MQVDLIKNNSADTNNYLEKLPKDVFTTIFDLAVFKDLNTFIALSQTCQKYFYALADQIDPTANHYEPFLKACKYGHYYLVKRWIEQNTNLSLSIKNNLPIRTICVAEMKPEGVSESRYCKLLDLFLERSKIDPTINPAAANNYCIRFACANGNAQIVRRLLRDGRSDPFDKESLGLKDTTLSISHAFRIACSQGYHEIVDVLLENTEIVIPSDEKEHYEKHPDLYIELEEFPKKAPFKSKKEYEWSLVDAAKNGHAKVVSRLLKFTKVDPCTMASAPIYVASENGHLNVVKLLLEDGRADPSADSNLALRYALNQGNEKMAALLRTSKRVLLGHLDYEMWNR